MRATGIFPQGNSLYLICDGETCARDGIPVADFVAGAVEAGAGIVQYRHKNIAVDKYEANLVTLLAICHDAATTLIVNDHTSLAEKYCLTLHLGQADVLPQEIGVPYGRSTHNFAELDRALVARPAPAYIALGTMFVSPTKPDIQPARALVGEYLNRTDLPLVLIGGITLENVHLLPRSERIFYAVIADAFRFGATKEGIKQYASAWNSVMANM